MNPAQGILRLVLAVLAAGAGLAVLAGIVLAVLVATGSAGTSGECRAPGDGGQVRPVVNRPVLAGDWQMNWDGFNTVLDSGQNSSVSFDESQTTSRANKYIEDSNVPVISDVTICFHPGEAEASGKAEVPWFSGIPILGGLFDAKASVAGTMDLSGAHPRIAVDEVDVGNVPGFIANRVKSRIESAVNGKLDEFDFEHTYSIAFAEGQVTIDGSP